MSKKTQTLDTGAAYRLCCPCCQGYIYRVPRRLRDIWISVLVPVRRYACRSLQCGWEGNLRRPPARTGGTEADDQRSYIL